MSKRVLSGIQPSGKLHLGNYFGAIKQFIERQEAGDELFIFVADWHALTSVHDKEKLKKSIEDVILTYLACGLDPEKVTLYRQSDVPKIQELAWILGCLTPMGLLERAHSYKDKVAKGLEATCGLFTYPVLMASDILIMHPDMVPVGKDQKQHVEIARDLAVKFNHVYGETFKLPEPEIKKDTATVLGTDGQKMSKSYNNTIPLFADEAEMKKIIMSIKTDSKLPNEPKNPDEVLPYSLLSLISPDRAKEILPRVEQGGMGYGDMKKILLEEVLIFTAEFRKKRTELEKNPEMIKKILDEGAEKARTIAKKTLAEVREKVGL